MSFILFIQKENLFNRAIYKDKTSWMDFHISCRLRQKSDNIRYCRQSCRQKQRSLLFPLNSMYFCRGDTRPGCQCDRECLLPCLFFPAFIFFATHKREPFRSFLPGGCFPHDHNRIFYIYMLRPGRQMLHWHIR